MNSLPQCPSFKKLLFPFYLLVCAILLYIPVNAQEKPPKPITVTVSVSQHLNFGTIIPNGAGGGTVTVDYGGRSSTLDVIIPATLSIFTPALFIVTALPGTLITIQGSPTALTGSNGGSMILTMIDSDPKSPFIVPPTNTPGGVNTEVEVKVGGMLTVGTPGANPPGLYGGPFIVTFIQQ